MLANRTMHYKYFVGLILLKLTTTSFGGDNLALLSGTLRTFQRRTCDSDKVSLACPRGTSISIELAQYEKNGSDGYSLCPLDTIDTVADVSNRPVKGLSHQESCLFPNALQYSLLQTAIEACQKRTQCKFFPEPKSFGGNPCPGIRKIVEYAYKCRPYEFRSKVACENEVIQLTCNPFSRIAIYSASYGRTEYESIQCTQPQGVKEETCLVSYATETAMQICHGKRRCTITADATTFGNPCRADSRMYLKTVYTCVPRGVLKDDYDFSLEADEEHQVEPPFINELDEDDSIYKEAVPPAPKLQGTIPRSDGSNNSSTQTTSTKTSQSATSVLIQSEDSFREEDRHDELFYICLLFAIVVLILLSSILFVIGRIVLNKRRVNNAAKLQTSETGTTAIPTECTETISDEIDIDLATTATIPSISRNNQMYNTYTPSSYGNLEPSSISYALVTPNCYSSNPAVHGGVVRPPNTYNAPPPNLRNVNAVTFHTQHHVLIPSGTQTLNRQVYRINPNPNAVVTAGSGITVATTALQQPDETAKYLYG